MSSSYLSTGRRVFWYNSDCHGCDDRGWGCGWRCTQTAASLLFDQHQPIADIARTLAALGINTRIGSAADTDGDRETEIVTTQLETDRTDTDRDRDRDETFNARLAFMDVGWISEYFDAVFPESVDMKMFIPEDIKAMKNSLREMAQAMQELEEGGGKKRVVVILVCAGMIVCIDAIEDGTIGHFIDPHVYETVTEMPPLKHPGSGGIGNYCLIKLMQELIQPLCDSIEDQVLKHEMELNALEYISPCFLMLSRR